MISVPIMDKSSSPTNNNNTKGNCDNVSCSVSGKHCDSSMIKEKSDKITKNGSTKSKVKSDLETGLKYREKIDTLRDRFSTEYSAHPELYDEIDFRKVMDKDFWVTRFMADPNESIDDTFEKLRSTMEWRKSFGVNHFDPLSIPKEIYQVSALIPYEVDKQGRPTLYIRGKIHRKIDQLEDKIKHYLVNMIETIDSVREERESWLIILDASDANFFNTDLDMIMFLFSTLRTRYPRGVGQCLLYGLPWLLGAFANMVISFLPSDSVAKIKFGGKKELLELIDENNLPDWLGGSCKVNYRRVPRSAVSCYDMAETEFKLTKQEVDKIIKPFTQYIMPELCVEIDP
ncbi:motile sperm domain-containing protein 2-like [Panonychus citri]|uniref:motile sperm domain-containing protein 2-like n=1 Tax=Panonychus citri TaxID=50023 RepID=UPI002307E4B9|nr:motile sperm domain-containing protein 2-like [Panonychus citri]